jgi:hypothetical protein
MQCVSAIKRVTSNGSDEWREKLRDGSEGLINNYDN